MPYGASSTIAHGVLCCMFIGRSIAKSNWLRRDVFLDQAQHTGLLYHIVLKGLVPEHAYVAYAPVGHTLVVLGLSLEVIIA